MDEASLGIQKKNLKNKLAVKLIEPRIFFLHTLGQNISWLGRVPVMLIIRRQQLSLRSIIDSL